MTRCPDSCHPGRRHRRAPTLPALLMLLAFCGFACFFPSSASAQDAFSSAILEPDSIGVERFAARVSAARDNGGEPLGLVLSGGLARAFAHIGVLKVMEELGIQPDFIVADSLGAVIGLMYAAGIHPDAMAGIAIGLARESLFDPVIPGSGGFLNANRFAALIRFLSGNPDVGELPIPVLIVADDLSTGRQVRIAAGDIGQVAAVAIALPAIFEPVPFEGRLLLDGGSTDLVPVAVASEYSDNVLVSATLHDRPSLLSGAISVVVRSFDAKLARIAIHDLENFRPSIIRNDVEQISNMAFADAESIIEMGVASARESPALALAAARHETGAVGAAPAADAKIKAARAMRAAALLSAMTDIERGVKPHVGQATRFTLALKIAEPYREGLYHDEGLRYATLNLFGLTGTSSASAGVLAGVDRNGIPAGGVSAEISVNPVDALAIDAGARVWFSGSEALRAAEGTCILTWGFSAQKFVFSPYLRINGRVDIPDPVLGWEFRAGADLDLRSGLRREIAGARASAGYFLDSKSSYGPEWSADAAARISAAWLFETRMEGLYRIKGAGSLVRSSGMFRGVLPVQCRGLGIVAGADIFWTPPGFAPEMGDFLIVRDFGIGPYVDIAWADSGNGSRLAPAAGATGIAMALNPSPMGLLRFDFGAFAGLDFDGKVVLGLRTGTFLGF